MRKQNYSGRWGKLIKTATNVLDKMLLLASKSPRNYIIDQVKGKEEERYYVAPFCLPHLHPSFLSSLPSHSLPPHPPSLPPSLLPSLSPFSSLPCPLVPPSFLLSPLTHSSPPPFTFSLTSHSLPAHPPSPLSHPSLSPTLLPIPPSLPFLPPPPSRLTSTLELRGER